MCRFFVTENITMFKIYSLSITEAVYVTDDAVMSMDKPKFKVISSTSVLEIQIIIHIVNSLS